MSTCALKKLKVTFNNPNLPVLETMQQFTLDAIALSGNNSMTDTQKLALNHFFYQIGAVGNTNLWQKVKFLFLPMICGDNVATALNDYLSKTVNAAAGSPSFVNHGLHYNNTPSTQIIGTDIFSGASNDLSLLQASMNTSFVVKSGFTCMIDKGDPSQRRTINGINLSVDNTYYVGNVPNMTMQTPTISENIYDVGCVVSAADSAYVKIGSTIASNYITHNATPSELESRDANVNYSDNYLRLGMGGNGIDLGLIMVAQALSDEESTRMLDAIKGLKQAFSESNS